MNKKNITNEDNNIKDELLKRISMLCDDSINIIKEFIPKKVSILLSKKTYQMNHELITSFIPKKEIENYIRTMIRQDNDYVFKQILYEKYYKWISMYKYYHKDCIYSNYVYFLVSYCLDNNSSKCHKLLTELLELQGLSKNQHKKKTTQYIRWKT